MRKALVRIATAVAIAALAACSAHGHSSILPATSATHKPLAIGGPSVVQTAAVTSSLGGTFANAPANGDLLVAIGFNAVSTIACASGWTAIRHVTANYADGQDCYRIASGDTAAQTPFAGTASSIAGEIWEVNGQAVAGFIDAQTGAESTTPDTVTLTFAPAFTGDLILGASAVNTKLAGTAPTGFTTDASASPAGTTGFSDLSAHEGNGPAGTQSVTWAYSSTTDTHPVTAMMVAIDGIGGATGSPSPSASPSAPPSASPSPPPSSSPSPAPTPTIQGGGTGLSLVQRSSFTNQLGGTLSAAPANGDLLVAIGFDARSSIACAPNWILIRHLNANYADVQTCYRIASGDSPAQTPFAGTAKDTAGEIWEISGQASSGFIDAETGAEGGVHSLTLSFSPPHTGDLIVGASAINAKLQGITPPGFTNDSGSSPAGATGFSDLSAHENLAPAGAQSVTWAYNSSTDTHPVTADMIAIYGLPSTSTPSPPPSSPPSPTPPPPSLSWTTMGYDLMRTGYNPNETTIGPSNVGSVHAVWTHSIGSEIGEPVYAAGVNINGVSTNVLYASSASQETAMNADTGAVIWTHALSTSSYMCGTGTFTFGANGAPAADRTTNRLYVPDGAANVHAFNMSTGAELSGWPINIATPADHNFIYGAVTFNPANGMLYAETSSTCDISPWQGRITAINTMTASIVNTFFPAQGASGGGIWGFGGASVDPSTNDVFIAVGNGDTANGGSQTASYSEQVVSLSPDLSTVLGHFYASLPVGPDNDFGATPLLFQPPGCPLLAAAENKSGLFVLYTASNISAGPLQTIQMAVTSDAGDFVGLPAYDPVTHYVYVGLPSTEGIYKPGLGAFSIQANCTLNPTPVWNANFGADGSTSTSDTLRSPISIANGVVYVSDYQTNTTYAFDAAGGAQLWSHTLNGKGVVGPIVVNGRLYTSDITGQINAWSP